MPAVPTGPANAKPVQEFKPTTGVVVAYVGLVGCALALLLLAVTERTVGGLRAALVVALVALLIWVVMLRPRATAYARTLVLHGMVSDVELPLARIDTVVVRQMLMVWIGEERYDCTGIGRSTRKLLGHRSRGAMAVLGLEQTDDRMGLRQVGEIGTSGDYATFVETRIEDLAKSARRDQPPDGVDGWANQRVRRTWSRPELTALGVLVAALVVSFLL